MILLSTNVIAFLNSRHAGDALIICLIILAFWSFIWRQFLGEWLYKQKASSFWYLIYELGPLGSFGVMLVLSLLLILFIASFQAVSEYGAKMLLSVGLFWGAILAFAIFFIKKIKK